MNDDLKKIEQAQQFIKQEDYGAARHILITMPDNTQATNLLKMLEKTEVETPLNMYPDVPPITQLGSYRLHKMLGEGGMGTIYESYQGSMKRKVAIKVLPPQLAKDPEYIKRFTSEIELATRLEHIHILPIYDYGVDRNISYIVMRFLGGGDLEDRILKQGHIPLEDGLRIIQQIGSALEYAHNQNVIHRDLKASNIMFDEQDNAFLMDFGIAKAIGSVSITQTGYVMGTPHYMPPEQWHGANIDKRVDVYALAVLSYYMFTGKLPYNGESQLSVMYQHFNETPPPLHQINPKLPQTLNMIIDKGLAKDADSRYESASELVKDLLIAADTKPITIKTDAAHDSRKETLELPVKPFAPAPEDVVLPTESTPPKPLRSVKPATAMPTILPAPEDIPLPPISIPINDDGTLKELPKINAFQTSTGIIISITIIVIIMIGLVYLTIQ